MLPLAMLCGVLFHEAIDAVQFLAPYLIFTMLLITFCKVNPHEFRITRMTWLLLAVQIPGSVAVYLALRPIDEAVAQGAAICVLCPTATAAPVITGMLGGSVARLATFSIVSNAAVAVTAPIMFAAVGSDAGQPDFGSTFGRIATHVAPMILLPLATAFVLRGVLPKVHGAIASHQSLSFYLWAVSLIIVVGRAVSFVMSEPAGRVPQMVAIAGAQGLGQKNTVLAIWMSLTYLNPISSVGPAAYVAWQNTINSAQLYVKAKRDRAAAANHHN